MDEGDVLVRNVTYQLFVDRGHPPNVADVATAAGSTADEISASWRRLHDAHAIVLHPDTTELRMANPFSAVATPYRVHAAGRSWFANCAWDAFGICAALHVDGRIETSCPDCHEAISCEVRAERPSDQSLLFHCLVPAAAWWDDIVFT